jgi:carbonic anhydrase
VKLIRKIVVAAFVSGVIVVAPSLSVAQESKPSAHEWSYEGEEGPTHWGDLEPDFAACRLGKHQSPIDIRDAKPASLPPIKFDYKSSPLKIVNNGHSIQINYAPGSYMVVGEKRYELQQFHFHHPSEEYINGKPYDMAIHLVHADNQGHSAVVTVLLKKGNTNSMIQKLWDNLPRAEGKEEAVPSVEVSAAALLPETLSYYTFEGSLTTPPCSEPVTWYVLKTPLEVSAAEAAAFARLYPHNARPLQSLNGRAILEGK